MEKLTEKTNRIHRGGNFPRALALRSLLVIIYCR